jgi:phage recombination protein Bet
MAQAPQAMTIAPRHTKPPSFQGTEVAWRALCDLYPMAETPEVIMAVMDYCAVRRLDPFKRPVHIVPMYNSKLRRKVQTVMQGINEIEITAHRTGRFAGMDPPKWGPEVERTFRGQAEDQQGNVQNTQVTMKFPVSCAVTVYRMVGNQRVAFTEELFWEESYARASFRSEVPNARWQQAPRQMLHKCTKAAVLRAAFPEEGFGYTKEEMEDREVEDTGTTIDGTWETPRERQEPAAAPEASGNGGSVGPTKNSASQWLDKLEIELASAGDDRAAVDRILFREDVMRMANWFTGTALERFDGMKRAAVERTNPAPPPADDMFPGDKP